MGEEFVFRSDVVAKVADKIGNGENSLHEHSPWRAREIVMCNPDHGAYQHQLPETFIILTKSGYCCMDGCDTAQNRQQSFKRKN